MQSDDDWPDPFDDVAAWTFPPLEIPTVDPPEPVPRTAATLRRARAMARHLDRSTNVQGEKLAVFVDAWDALMATKRRSLSRDSALIGRLRARARPPG